MNGLFLLLGCDGFIKNDFTHCCSSVNKIIDFSKIEKDKSKEILDFLDNALELFEGRVKDHYKCMNALNYIQKNILQFDVDMLYNIEFFAKNHKHCGIYLMLNLEEN